MRLQRTWRDGAGVARVAGYLWVRCDWNDDFVQALKNAVPGFDRDWNAADRSWVIHERHERVVRRLLAEHLNEYVVVTEE